MKNLESPAERKKRFKSMSSFERKELIRAKMQSEGLEEGSGVKGVNYNDDDEVLDLIRLTSCFPEMQNK